MEYLFNDPSPRERAELSICIFPHLAEFLVIDARAENPDGPRLIHLTANQILTEQFYEKVEERFRKILRRSDQPLSYLMTLPRQLEALLRYRSLKAIVAAVSDGAPVLPGQVALLICSGDILDIPASQIGQIFDHMAGEGTDPQVISDWTSQFELLLVRERLEVKRELEQHKREAVDPMGSQFFTLWENPN